MRADLKLGDQPIRNVRLLYGGVAENWPMEREHVPGRGAFIEVPAVLEVLDRSLAGELDTAGARRLLGELGEQVVRRTDPHGCGIKGCVDSHRCWGELAESQLQELLRRERADAALAGSGGVAEPAVHPCRPCTECSNCSCYDGTPGLCQTCRWTRGARLRARQDVERWNGALASEAVAVPITGLVDRTGEPGHALVGTGQ
ncbi:hypothetical protein [Kitasatospora sp. NPDC089509]|uniref:hypothetical protein n=1 Tax=Kitasatospora sp. NPDC089509 TaxID=3364079 RepID=UPI0038196702